MFFGCCVWARAPGSLAGGFLVAVAGCALFVCCGFVWFCLSRDSVGMVLLHCFTFSPAQWASPQLNGPVQLFHNLFWTRQLTDRAILANRQTQEKKGKRLPKWEPHLCVFWKAWLGISTPEMTICNRKPLNSDLKTLLAKRVLFMQFKTHKWHSAVETLDWGGPSWRA